MCSTAQLQNQLTFWWLPSDLFQIATKSSERQRVDRFRWDLTAETILGDSIETTTVKKNSKYCFRSQAFPSTLSLSLSLRVRSMRKRDFGFQRRSEGLNTEKKKSTKATSTSPDTCPPGDRKVAYAVCRWSWRLLESWAPLHVAWGNPCLPQSAKCWNTLTWPKPFLPGGQFFPDNYKVNHLLLFRYYLINLYLISIWSNKKK